MKKYFSAMIALAVLTFAAGCGGGGEKKAEKAGEQATQEATETATSSGYQSTSVTNGGTIKGTVTFAGAIPKKQVLEVTKDVNVCGKVTHYKENLLVADNKGIANVVVSIKNISQGKSLESLGESFHLDQDGCAFRPHVSIVPAGVKLTIKNDDGILHNIHTYSDKNAPINMAQPGFKKVMTHTFDEPEVVRVACDVHNWMGGYIVVVDNPYTAITDEHGNFQLTDVPAGTYTLEYWQETLGTQTAEVTVTEGGTVEANFEFAAGSAQIDDSVRLASKTQ